LLRSYGKLLLNRSYGKLRYIHQILKNKRST
jgi:hypothetical protein